MKNIVLTFLASLLTLTVYNTASCSNNGQPENEALATEIKSFTIRVINQTSIISWSSIDPMENDYFTVERSTDGKTFTQIGKLKSDKSTSFTFIDYKPNAQINYYRFKKVELDGTVAVSPVRVSIPDRTSPFKTYPSIVSDTLTIENTETADLASDFKVEMVLTSTGEVMYETPLVLSNKKMGIALATLPEGHYVARIKKGNKVYNHKFLKQ